MKNITFFIIIFISGVSIKSQIIVEETYTNIDRLAIVKLDSVTNKYLCFTGNDTTLSITLNNLDHSLYNSMDIDFTSFLPPEWFDTTNLWKGAILDPIHLSKYLFDLDSDIDILCEGEWGYQDSSYTGHSGDFVCIFNENGSILFSENNATLHDREFLEIFPASISTTENGTKMILKVENDWKVYSVPGAINNKTSYITHNNGMLFSYPNPTKNYVNIDYKLPDGVNQGKIIIYNQYGQEISTYKVDRTFNHIEISTSVLQSGTYFYSLQSEDELIICKKIIVLK